MGALLLLLTHFLPHDQGSSCPGSETNEIVGKACYELLDIISHPVRMLDLSDITHLPIPTNSRVTFSDKISPYGPR